MFKTFIVCFFSASALYAASDVTIEVKVPTTTPQAATVFIAGNASGLGNWDPGKVKLKKKNKDTWFFKGDFDKEIIEYKFTLGSWASVEKSASGNEIENRRETVRGKKMTIKNEVKSWSAGGAERKHTITGRIDVIEDFPSKILKNTRRIQVWLPPSYKKSGRSYPVLYMHDGQNVFDECGSFIGAEWGADEACDLLIKSGKIQEIIIVAVDNKGEKRIYEYAPFEDSKRGGGGGDLYARFIVSELKPFIDGKYRTLKDRDNTAVCGSSLGGLISLYMGLKYWEVFSGIGVLSPAFFWADYAIFDYVKEREMTLPARVWLDIGTAEGGKMKDGTTDAVRDCRKMRTLLEKKGIELKYFEDAGAPHNETAWRKRFPAVLEYLFKKK